MCGGSFRIPMYDRYVFFKMKTLLNDKMCHKVVTSVLHALDRIVSNQNVCYSGKKQN